MYFVHRGFFMKSLRERPAPASGAAPGQPYAEAGGGDASQQTLYVTFLGRFTLSGAAPDTLVATAPGRSSRRLWAFLQYLCAFHQKETTQEELIDALWGETEVADPVGALKTILHRARALLERLGFPDGKKVLLYRRGRYFWSPNVELRLDTEELDRLYAGFSTAPGEVLPEVLEFLPKYEGDFLPDLVEDSWALSLRTFYHTRYLHLAWGAAKLLQSRGRLDEAIGVCRTATTLDPYDERCQLLLIRLLHSSGAVQAALRHYSAVSGLYMDQLGVSPSSEMLALYQEISRAGDSERLELSAIQALLLERGDIRGPFFCEYAVFQDIYRLVARSMARSGAEAQLVLLTINERGGGPLDPRQRSAAMETLRAAGLSLLRPGDVAARTGPGQMLLLLPATSRERAGAALGRILDAFGHTPVGMSVQIQTDLLPVLPTHRNTPEHKGGKQHG